MLTLTEMAQPLLNRGLGNRLLDFDLEASDIIVLDVSSDDLARSLAGSHVRRVAMVTKDALEAVARTVDLVLKDSVSLNQTGVSALYLGLRFARWQVGVEAGAAPLILCPIRFVSEDGQWLIERTGAFFANPALIDRLGPALSALPDDPLSWSLEDLEPYGVTAISGQAAVASLDAVRWLQVQRLDPSRSPLIERHRLGRAMATLSRHDDRSIAFEDFDKDTVRIHGSLDGTQLSAFWFSQLRANTIVMGGPGTGKTLTLFNVILAALKEARPVIFIGGRVSAIQAMIRLLLGGTVDAMALHLYGPDCHPQAIAERYGVEARETVAETLLAVPLRYRWLVLTTPEGYALHAPAEWRYEIVVVDEASLIPLVEVLPAITVCRQVVIAGDTEQMHKSSSFDPPGSPAYTRDMLTLFDAATKAGFYRVQLSTHYRSRHPSLIHLSNMQFYQGRMLVCPSPHDTEWIGFRWQRVEGAMDAEALTNVAEAEAVVDQIAHHIEAGQTMSIGVVAMTSQQANLISRMIAERGLDLSSVTQREPLFVVDYAAVQGLERDVILISTVVSRDPGPDGKTLDFGPLTYPEEGPRIINVIATRSREMIRMFTSFSSEDVPVGRSLEHMMLFNLMVFVKHGFRQSAWSSDSVFDAIAKRCGWRARSYDVAYGLFDPKTGEAGVLVYVTGRLRDDIDACFAQNYRDNRWVVHEITRERADGFEDDPEAQAAFAAELIALYRPDYDPDAEDEEAAHERPPSMREPA